MRKLIAAMSLALLLAGCGDEAKKKAVVDKWAEWEANPKPFGGLKTLAKIKKAKESGATTLDLYKNQFGLTKLERLDLSGNEITDVSPLKGLTKLEYRRLDNNKIGDVKPLARLKDLWKLRINDNNTFISISVF